MRSIAAPSAIRRMIPLVVNARHLALTLGVRGGFFHRRDQVLAKPAHADQASSCRPCFSTMASSFKAMPLGRLAPVSHFSTVDSLVLR